MRSAARGANSEQKYGASALAFAAMLLVAMLHRPIIPEGGPPLVRSLYFAVAALLFCGALGWLFYTLWRLPF